MAEGEETKASSSAFKTSMNLNQLSISIWTDLAPLKQTSAPII